MITIEYKKELYRKILHLSSLWIVFSINYIDHYKLSIFMILITISSFLIEYYRNKKIYIQNLYNKLFFNILRNHEKEKSFTGGCYLLLSSSISILFFDKIISISAISVLIIADSASALIGKYIGRNYFDSGKTKEGFYGFIIFSIITLYIIGMIYSENHRFYIISIFVSIFASIVELNSSKLNLDDNLTVPLSVAIFMKLFL